ncbi:hypothetical protein Tco_0579355 [Tanacetum coccineum]
MFDVLDKLFVSDHKAKLSRYFVKGGTFETWLGMAVSESGALHRIRVGGCESMVCTWCCVNFVVKLNLVVGMLGDWLLSLWMFCAGCGGGDLECDLLVGHVEGYIWLCLCRVLWLVLIGWMGDDWAGGCVYLDARWLCRLGWVVWGVLVDCCCALCPGWWCCGCLKVAKSSEVLSKGSEVLSKGNEEY